VGRTVDQPADGPYLLRRLANDPARYEKALELIRWNGGGNHSSGVGIGNIDTQGNVHPDQFWQDHTLGNVKETPFSQIWSRTDDPILTGLRTRPRQEAPPAESFTLPLRLSEAAQERIQGEIEDAGGRMVGTRPLFKAIKAVARDALRQVILLALGAVLVVVALFGRRPRFLLLALLPLAASQIGVLGLLGWTGEPLTFLSLVAIPIALGVSVDTAMNLLHRARLEPQAAARVARVNAVCAGTTLAGFGGLVFSGYRGLRGLGLASLGGVALALLVTQWVLPWLLEKWPLHRSQP